MTVDRFDKITKRGELSGAFADITSFEKQLAENGVLNCLLYLQERNRKNALKS